MKKKISESKVREIVRKQLQIKKLNDLHESVLNETETGAQAMTTGMSGQEAWMTARNQLADKLKKVPKRWQKAAVVLMADKMADAFIANTLQKQTLITKAKSMGIDFSEELPADDEAQSE